MVSTVTILFLFPVIVLVVLSFVETLTVLICCVQEIFMRDHNVVVANLLFIRLFIVQVSLPYNVDHT